VTVAAGTARANSTLLPADLLRVGSLGLRTRRLRAGLSALGIAIGIAAMVAVLGISQSSKADLIAQLDRLGTNLLRVAPGSTLFGETAKLPAESPGMIGRIGPVQHVTPIGTVTGTVRRTDRIAAVETSGIGISAVRTDLLATLNGTMASGRFLDAATSRYPAVVLGATAAERLGISTATGPTRIFLADHWFAVVGILDPLPLAPELDPGALIGWPVAQSLLGFDGSIATIYVRANPDTIPDVRAVLAGTANPRHPDEVAISRPSDALAARAATKTAFTALLLGLGSVALLVGGVGIANVMVIAVLERRSEIGLRRALGATRRHIALQFITEALLLSTFGGVAGATLGALATAGYAATQSWTAVVPPLGLAGGIGAAVITGVVAGSYPAIRAARLAPTDALRTV
jgi:putative ABC transport system permease protein